MNKLYSMLFSIIVFAFLAGCSGVSVYFYETDKLSIAAEGRPDATSPVSFNFGFKQRTAIVVASKNQTSQSQAVVKPNEIQNTDSKGDAASMISYFNLVKESKDGWLNDPLTIEAGLYTGKVADELAKLDKDPGKDNHVVKALDAFIPTARYQTKSQSDFQNLFDKIDADPTTRDARFEKIAEIMPEEFRTMYQTKIDKKLEPPVAFLSTKNRYLSEERSKGEGPKFDLLIDAMNESLK